MNYTGWQCPVCKHVFAPHVDECPYCITQNEANYRRTIDGLSNDRRIEMAKEREAFFTGPLSQREDEVRTRYTDG